jgi:GTP-binding protein LepA
VIYKVHQVKGEVIDLQNPSSMPDPTQIIKIEEPWIKATVITPDEYLGSQILDYLEIMEPVGFYHV